LGQRTFKELEIKLLVGFRQLNPQSGRDLAGGISDALIGEETLHEMSAIY
jgi:hypothetical protein